MNTICNLENFEKIYSNIRRRNDRKKKTSVCESKLTSKLTKIISYIPNEKNWLIISQNLK